MAIGKLNNEDFNLIVKKGTAANLALGTTYLQEGELAFTTDTKKLYVGDAAGGKNQVGGASGGLATRTTATSTYTSLAAGATDSSQAPTFFKSFKLSGISITGNKKCRIRLYSTSAARAADLNRGYTVPLALGSQHGCIADFYFDQSIATTPWTCSPDIFGSNQDTIVAAVIYASVTNIDTTTQTIVITYTLLQLEN